MPSYRADPSRPDRAKAIGGVLAVYAALGAALLLARSDSPLDREQNPPTVLIDVIEPPEPQPPPEEQAAIVRFLDSANGRLQRTIQAKRKVIASLSPPSR